jgi:hypothetical protein
MDAAYRRLLGEGPDGVAGPAVRDAAGLAAAAASEVATAGRPLAAANAALTPPAEDHLALWHATTVLREHRGDGHVTALVAAGVEPCQSQVLAAAAGRSPAAVLRQNRRWSEQEWAAAVDSLAARGWVTPAGELTPAGRTARREIEEHTDRLALGPYAALGPERCENLVTALHGLAQRVVDAGGVPSPNPIGAPWPPTDEVT